MRNEDILYLGTKSKSRQKLIQIAGIDYKVLEHKSEECGIDIKHGFETYVLSIAQEKMEHLILPKKEKVKRDYIFVLTADTLVRTIKSNQILTKPKDVEDGKKMLKFLCQEPVQVVTACCLEKKKWNVKKWYIDKKIHWSTKTEVEFCVQDEYLDLYFQKMPNALNACSAGIIEGFGQNFLKNINGSYTSVIGLPLYELRQNLKKMNFKSKFL
ncbi:hypothetical protein GF322_01010 [Candidatus Dependentiae bacterium]|nr:hypothetical protein [Candidatus Dependentiae bacterium]